MLKKKTKIIILCGMIALLGLTAYLNIALNNRVVDVNANQVVYTSSFDEYRAQRQETREQLISLYDGIITSDAYSKEEIQSAKELKNELIERIKYENVTEGIIKSKGFKDATVSFSKEKCIVALKSEKALDQAQIAQVNQIVKLQTGYSAKNIIIIPS
ncbi:MAG: SpoIIIAH-like family protein [Clostridia bacterium]